MSVWVLHCLSMDYSFFEWIQKLALALMQRVYDVLALHLYEVDDRDSPVELLLFVIIFLSLQIVSCVKSCGRWISRHYRLVKRLPHFWCRESIGWTHNFESLNAIKLRLDLSMVNSRCSFGNLTELLGSFVPIVQTWIILVLIVVVL